jgi:hypothetical protein
MIDKINIYNFSNHTLNKPLNYWIQHVKIDMNNEFIIACHSIT